MLRKGELIQVSVESIFSFGVFCRALIDNSPGYIRKRELSLSGKSNPRQIVNLGQTLDVLVVTQANEGHIAELSWRRNQPDPWIIFAQQTHVGDTLSGSIKYIYPDRVIVEILPGVDGTIPLEEISNTPIRRPEEMLWTGDRIEGTVIRFDPSLKKLQLSIRHHLERDLLIHQFLDQVNQNTISDLNVVGLPAVIPEVRAPLNFQGHILVVEDDPAMRYVLADWLKTEGCEVESCSNGLEALERFDHQGYAVLISDINMPVMNGISLITAIKRRSPKTICCLFSDPNHIALYSAEIEALSIYVFPKPLETDEIRQFLEDLSQGQIPNRPIAQEENGQKDQPFGAIVAEMRGYLSIEERLNIALNHLLSETGAEKAILFHYDPISRLFTIAAQAGTLQVNETLLNNLVASPVEDVIDEDTIVWESRISTLRNDKYGKLLQVMPFETCIGVPVMQGDERNHAIFIFHRQPEVFTRSRVRDTQTCAALISVALEEELFRRRIQDASALLLVGNLSSAFNHEVYNKISVLDLQLELLNSAYGALLTTFPMVSDSGQAQKLGTTIGAVGQAVRALKNMATDFRSIMKGGSNQLVSLNHVIQQACDQVKPAITNASITVELVSDNNLPEIRSNSSALIYIIYNLLLNAVQHLENQPGERRIWVKLSREAVDGTPFMVIRIGDNGPGIHRQLWEKIFELGYTTRKDGSGLGLYIARSLVETLNGKIEVEDSLIKFGSTFKIQLPEEGKCVYDYFN